jgi:acetyl-CoA carboxylase carboxyl transferase subunit beta
MANIFDLFRERRAWLEGLAAKRRARRKAHAKIVIKSRIDEVLDPKGARRLFDELTTGDPLEFPDYAHRVADLAKRSGYADAVLCKVGAIEGNPVICVELLSEFMMGSMGTVVGETVTRAAEYATQHHMPLVIFSASGGARMQEGMFSLMQMAKTSAAIQRLDAVGTLFISVLTHPTTGGVTASFASLGDVTLAEPQALIGFAGPRVIEQTIGSKLPEGFQSAEFQLAHGFVDAVIERARLREVLARLLCLHQPPSLGGADRGRLPVDDASAAPRAPGRPAPSPPPVAAPASLAPATPPGPLYSRPSSGTPCSVLVPHQEVERARHAERPHVRDFIDGLFEDFFETCGDRLYRDDRSLICGIARFEGMPVTVAGHMKGTDLNENIACNFGMPHPEGYRKFQRALAQAAKFGRPVITFIDTPGAYPGAQAEERGQGEAIARCLYALSGVAVPVIAVVTGEGGSGGALALGLADCVLMFEHAVFSVLSPEGFASILWKDATRAREAAEVMRLTSADLFAFGMVDVVIEEPADDVPGGQQATTPTPDGSQAASTGKRPPSTAPPATTPTPDGSQAANRRALMVEALRPSLSRALASLVALDADELLARRHERYRRF